MASRRRLGIIGCGAVVQNNYLTALAYYPEIHLARVTDLNPDSTARVAAMSGATASSQEQIMADCEIVIIATPPASHPALVEASLTEGRTVICEKPFVGERAQASRLAQLAEDRKSKLFVAHFRRCFPSVRLARALVGSGILGNVTRITAYEGGRFRWQAESGYVYKDVYGGVLFDTGSHTLDMLLYAAGLDTETLSVTSAHTERDCAEPSNDLESNVSLLHGNNPVSGHFKFSRFAATANKVLVECENGFVELPVGLTNYVRLGNRQGRAVVVHASEAYADTLECFALQLKHMFVPDAERTFSAERFVNLTGLLESINKA